MDKHLEIKRFFQYALLFLFCCIGSYTYCAANVRGSLNKDESNIQGQKRKISGVIKDASGEPIIGASVSIKGTTIGTITDMDGKFDLDIPEDSKLLSVSYVGYTKQDILINDKEYYTITLKENSNILNEVVVTGFGLSEKKASLTGAISSIGEKNISRSLASTVSGTLVGKIAGINSRQDDGRPGASTTIQIRNMGTPLYVIDGCVKDEGQFNNLDMNDIEQITILKDASAAIYGVRAANGVVVVTTKHGKLDTPPSVNVNGYYGWQDLSRFAKPANAKTYIGNYIQSQTIQGSTYTYSKDDYEKWCQGTEKGYRPFDWYKYIWVTSPQTYFDVNASGGSNKTNYYFSVGHLDQAAMIRNFGGFYRTNVQFNLDSQINSKLKVGASMNGRIELRKNPGVPGSDDYWLPMFATYRNLPTARPYANDNPAYPALTSAEGDTNFAMLDYDLAGIYQDEWRVIQLNAHADYDITKDLKIQWGVGYYLAYEREDDHEYTYKLYGYDASTDTYPVVYEMDNPYRDRTVQHVEEKTSNLRLTYDHTFGQHHVAGIIGLDASSKDTPYTFVHSVPIANTESLISYPEMDEYDDSETQEARLGWLGRLNYDYANKYLIELSGRYDGEWKWAPGHRWGFFPSASVGWRISEEKFWRNWDFGKIINNLKLRASYGEVGDDNVDGYSAFDYLSGYTYGNGGSVIDGKWVVGSVSRGLPATTFSWIKAKIFDVGADITSLNNKLNGSFDYFRRKRTGLPASRYDILIPTEVGFGLPNENLNSDLQKGIDGSISYQDKWNDLNYSVGFNFTYARKYDWEQYKPRFNNSLDKYQNSSWHRYSNVYWGYKSAGQFQSWEQIAKYPVDIDGEGNKTLRPGDIIYKDLNGDGVINSLDQRPIGYPSGDTPIFNYGINVSLGWKGIDCSFDLTGASGMSFMPQYESMYPFHDGGNNPQYMLSNCWHLKDIWDANSELIPGKYPTPLIGNSSHSNYWGSDFWLINVHYLKLRNFELGYTLPEDWLKRFKVTSLRVYIAGTNVFTWSNKPGCDPEGTTASGLQYPTTRVINMGFNLKF